MYDKHKFLIPFHLDDCDNVFIISTFADIFWDIILNISMLIPIVGGYYAFYYSYKHLYLSN